MTQTLNPGLYMTLSDVTTKEMYFSIKKAHGTMYTFVCIRQQSRKWMNVSVALEQYKFVKQMLYYINFSIHLPSQAQMKNPGALVWMAVLYCSTGEQWWSCHKEISLY